MSLVKITIELTQEELGYLEIEAYIHGKTVKELFKDYIYRSIDFVQYLESKQKERNLKELKKLYEKELYEFY